MAERSVIFENRWVYSSIFPVLRSLWLHEFSTVGGRELPSEFAVHRLCIAVASIAEHGALGCGGSVVAAPGLAGLNFAGCGTCIWALPRSGGQTCADGRSLPLA